MTTYDDDRDVKIRTVYLVPPKKGKPSLNSFGDQQASERPDLPINKVSVLAQLFIGLTHVLAYMCALALLT